METTFVSSDPAHAEWWFEERKEAETLKYNPLAPSSIEALRERLKNASSDFNQFEAAQSFLWFVKSDGKLVGHVSIQNINRMMLTAEIAYGISSSMRGRGLATLTIRKAAEDIFARTPLRKLIAFVHEDNLASRRALEKVGFRLEGVLREHYLINGTPANEAIYGLLRGDILNN